MIKYFIKFLFLGLFCSSISLAQLYPELNETSERVEFDEIYNKANKDRKKNFSGIYKELKEDEIRDKNGYFETVQVDNPGSIEDAYLINQKFENKSRSIFSLSIYSSDIFSPVNNNLFDTIFKSNSSSGYGPLYLEFDASFSDTDKGRVGGLGYHLGFGFGYFQGLARSVGTNEQTKTRLTLWFVPIDLGVTYRASYNSMGLKFSAGLTGAGMIQSRSDFREDEKGKNLNRLGQGLFAMTRFDYSLGSLMKKTRKEIFYNYGFSNFRLNLDFKYQYLSFNGEEKELDFSGTSLGVGVSFDVL